VPSTRRRATSARGCAGGSRQALGSWLRFEITDWEAGRRWSWRVVGVPATDHVVEPLGPGRCRVAFAVPRWAPFYLPVCRAALRRLRDIALAEAD